MRPAIGLRWSILNFLVPGASRWWGRNQRAAVGQLGERSGVLITVRYPPDFDRIRRVPLAWGVIAITVDGRVVRTGRGVSGPIWVPIRAGWVTVGARSRLTEERLIEERVVVQAHGPTSVAIEPPIGWGRRFRTSHPARLSVSGLRL